MSRRTLGSCVLVVVLSQLAPGQQRKPGLTLVPREQTAVERTAQAYFRGDVAGVLATLSPLVAQVNEPKLPLIDQFLARQGVPDSATLLADARAVFVQQGLTQQLPKPGPRETLLVLRALNRDIGQALKTKAEHPNMMLPAATLDGYERAIWNLHVLDNHLRNARRFAEYMETLARAYPQRDRRQLKPDDRDLVEINGPALAAQIDQAIRDVQERDIELRVGRLRAAARRLESPIMGREQFRAASTVNADARAVASFFEAAKKSGRPIARESLRQPNAEQDVAELTQQLRTKFGDLITKAELLADGLHWWWKGRYGAGPEVFGLAKNAAAVTSVAAQLSLYLPLTNPVPTDPMIFGSQGAVPTYDRRHHYWWAWEDRRLIRFAPTSSSTTVVKERFKVQTTQFW